MTLMAECVADADPAIRWTRPFIGILPNEATPNMQVQNLWKVIEPKYKFMCEAIDDAMDAEVLQAWLVAIEDIQEGRAKEVEKSTEGWAFQISPEGVTFQGEFDQGSGGEVTLEQFKLAVSAFRDFLNDPERKSIEIAFPG